MTGITSIDGSAATLTTTRTLWGQNFNGSGNVTGSLSSVGDITGAGAVTLTATAAALNLTATGANAVTINTNGSPRVTVSGTGDVGIGVTNPGAKLDVYGTSRFGGTTSTGRRVDISTDGILTLSYGNNANSTQLILDNVADVTATTDHGSTILWRLATNTTTTPINAGSISVLKETQWTTTASTQDSYMAFGLTQDGTNAEKVRITSAGNVGIGTTSPSGRLEVTGGWTYTESIWVKSTNSLYLNSGNFSLGPAGSGMLMQVAGAPNNNFTISSNDFIVTGYGGAGERLRITNSGEIRILEDVNNGTNYVGFKAPTSLAANTVWTLPSADGTNGQALVTNGSGVLSWAAAGSGGVDAIEVMLFG